MPCHQKLVTFMASNLRRGDFSGRGCSLLQGDAAVQDLPLLRCVAPATEGHNDPLSRYGELFFQLMKANVLWMAF